jgi:hypothetical protein
MIGLGVWSEAEHEKLTKEIEAEVLKAQKEAESYGSLADGHTSATARCSTTSTRTCRTTCAASGASWESDRGADDDDPGAAQRRWT